MKVRSICAAIICTQLSGCFFVFIPGSLIAKASDGITGAEGDHCVGRAAVAGSRIRATDGNIYVVKSLSGTSMRCADPAMPIRAALALEGQQQAYVAPVPRIESPPGEPTVIGLKACRQYFEAIGMQAPAAQVEERRLALTALSLDEQSCKKALDKS